MLSFTEVFQRLDAMGLTDVLLPFALIFSVIFAILSTIGIFKQKNINVIVALVIALLVVVPHVTGGYPAGKDVVEIINTAIPNVSVIIIAVLMFLILLGVFGVPIDITKSDWIGPIVGLLSLGAVIYIFGNSAGWFGGGSYPSWLGFLNNSDTVSVLLVILMFVGIIAFITGDSSKGGAGARLGTGIHNVLQEFGKIMK
jgi:hypothetical protein